MPNELNPNKLNAPSYQNQATFLFNKIFKKVASQFHQTYPNGASVKTNLSFFLKSLFTPPTSHQNIFGLDIGTSSIKLVQIVHAKAGLELANLWIEELPFASKLGTNQAVEEILKKIISENNIQGRVVASIGGDTVNIQSIQIPFMPDEEIPKALQWEARDELRIDLDNTVMDYVVLGQTDKSGTKQIDILLITVPKTVVLGLINAISKLGVIPYAFEPPPLAVVEAFGKDEFKQEGQVVGLLELGAGLTNLSIIVDGLLRFTRNIPISSSAFTDDIVDYCNIDRASAEKLKIKYGLGGISDDHPVETTGSSDERLRVSQAMNFKMEKLVPNIDHTFKFYLHQLSKLSVSNFDKLILSGGGALLKGLDKFLSSRLDVPVVIANPFKKIFIDEVRFDRKYLKTVAPRFSLSVGLALRKDGF